MVLWVLARPVRAVRPFFGVFDHEPLGVAQHNHLAPVQRDISHLDPLECE
jgi:hypothetical protein